MERKMKYIVSALKKIKWLSWAVLAALVLAVMWFFRTLFTADPSAPAKLPEVPDKLKKKVAKAEEDSLTAKVKAKAEAEKAKEVLDRAAEIEDDAERRKSLADALRNL